jgi:hypothetical protein
VAEFARAEMITSSEAVPAPPPIQRNPPRSAEAAETGATPARKPRRGAVRAARRAQGAEEPAEAAPQAEPGEVARRKRKPPPAPRQRALFGRAPGPRRNPRRRKRLGRPSEVDEMMDALRASQEDKPRRFLRR